MNELWPPSAQKAPGVPHFPAEHLAVIWRNWGVIPAEDLAAVLEAGEADIRTDAALMGLDPALQADPVWRSRGYLSVIRDNWHLLEYDQLTRLLRITPAELAFILKEDDFMWHKMGNQKPAVDRPVWRPLSHEERARAAQIPEILKKSAGALADMPENAFEFLRDYEKAPADAAPPQNAGENLRMVYSYFAVYGDPLLDESLDPFPDGLLAAYARYGINAVWLQGILYQLLPFPYDESLSAGWEKRLSTLKRLVERAKRYGIGIYLYFNEPRAHADAFFQKYPHLRGTEHGGYYALCTSVPEVRQYLTDATRRLFEAVPGLAGLFTITLSENLTNCHSKGNKSDVYVCPRCAGRETAQIVAEVNDAIAAGVRLAGSQARVVAWTWAWNPAWSAQAVAALTENVTVQATSEQAMPTCVGGVKGVLADYSMSIPGPGEMAKNVWRAARARGLRPAAKMQINNTWEVSAFPYIPVYDLVAQHVENVKAAGVRDALLSWTLGGCPAPNLLLAARLFSTEKSAAEVLPEFLRELYGELAPAVDEAQKQLCAAFREFPFHVGVLYRAPQNYGPKTLYYTRPTGHASSMIGFPFDDLAGWRAIYPANIFENQWRLLCEGWEKGLAMLQAAQKQAAASANPLFDELLLMTEGVYAHFRSSYNLLRFVRLRDELAQGKDTRAELRAVLEDDREQVLRLMRLRAADSRVGFEASNHYYYIQQDLKEKLLNIAYCLEYYAE